MTLKTKQTLKQLIDSTILFIEHECHKIWKLGLLDIIIAHKIYDDENTDYIDYNENRYDYYLAQIKVMLNTLEKNIHKYKALLKQYKELGKQDNGKAKNLV